MKSLLTLFALLVTSLAFGQESCPNVYDYNDNNTIDIEDFLGILGLFADDDTDDDGIWDSQDDCIDLEACNYAVSPTEPCAFLDVLGECGGGCEGDGDGDGICDDEDDCVGVVDECGVCNGPGPTEVVIEGIEINYDSIFLPVDDEWFVYAVEVDTTFGFTCATFFSDCGDPVSYQGYDYATVLIGEQCWFAENLRSENYENGDAIPSNLSDSEWEDTISGAIAVFGEGNGYCEHAAPDGDACDEVWSLNAYGRLYNWYAVDDARGLCPSGWRIPNSSDWSFLVNYVEGVSQLKATYGWNVANGSNASGFEGLPGGYRTAIGHFLGAGDWGAWWSLLDTVPAELQLNSINDYLIGYGYDNDQFDSNLRKGLSVRCIQDSE